MTDNFSDPPGGIPYTFLWDHPQLAPYLSKLQLARAESQKFDRTSEHAHYKRREDDAFRQLEFTQYLLLKSGVIHARGTSYPTATTHDAKRVWIEPERWRELKILYKNGDAGAVLRLSGNYVFVGLMFFDSARMLPHKKSSNTHESTTPEATLAKGHADDLGVPSAPAPPNIGKDNAANVADTTKSSRAPSEQAQRMIDKTLELLEGGRLKKGMLITNAYSIVYNSVKADLVAAGHLKKTDELGRGYGDDTFRNHCRHLITP